MILPIRGNVRKLFFSTRGRGVGFGVIAGICLLLAFPLSTEAKESTPSSAGENVGVSPATVSCPVDPKGDLYAMVQDSTGVDFITDTTGVSVHTDPPTSGNWVNEDVNDDGRIDIGTRDPEGSKYGSLYKLYVACEKGRYVQVLSKEAYDLQLAKSGSNSSIERPVSPYAATVSGSQWRQLIHEERGVSVLPHRPNVSAVSRVYRMYEDLGRYAMVPGSAWYIDDVPYSKSILRQVERLPPNCNAGRKPPEIIGNDDAEKVIWTGKLNNDNHKDIITREKDDNSSEYLLKVYAGCKKLWYSPVYKDSVLNFNVVKGSGKHRIWKTIEITKYKADTMRDRVLKYKHAEYEPTQSRQTAGVY